MADLLSYYKNALVEKTRAVEELRVENEKLKSKCQRIEYMNEKLNDQSTKLSTFLKKLAIVKNRTYKNEISEEKNDQSFVNAKLDDEILISNDEKMDLEELKPIDDSQIPNISGFKNNENLRRKINLSSKLRQENLKSIFRLRKQKINSVKSGREIWILKRSLNELKSQLSDAKLREKEKNVPRKNEQFLRRKLRESLEEISSLRNGEEMSILQNGVERLNEELAKCRAENLALKTKIENLTDEISSLRSGEEVSILQNGVDQLNSLMADCRNEQCNWNREKVFLNKNADSYVQQIDFMRKLCMNWCLENSNLQKRIDFLKSRLEKIDKSKMVDQKSKISIDFNDLIANWQEEKCRLKSELLKLTSIHERFRDEFLRIQNSIRSQFNFLTYRKIDLEKTLAETSNLCQKFQTQNRTLTEFQRRYGDDISTLKNRFFHTKKRYFHLLKSYTTLNKNFRDEKACDPDPLEIVNDRCNAAEQRLMALRQRVQKLINHLIYQFFTP
uniref:Uncharacterized protein n=1 Tax=Romanomermis culicivorax TaxID=13658 RepID=A0A915HPW5_ROMCU